MFVSVLIQHFLKINVSCSVFLPNLICRWQDFPSLVQAPWNSPHRSSSCDFYIGYSAYELRPALRCVTWKPSGGGRALGQRVRRAGWRGTESLSGPDTSCFENGQTKESNQGEGNAEESLWCSCLTEWSSCRWVLPPRCLAAWHCECKAMCKSCQCGVKLFLHLSKVWFSDVLFSC